VKTLGLTGGIGMGKSACAKLLRAREIPVIDTDDLARRVVEPGKPALEEVKRAFGLEVIDSEGRLRREVLARRVFADANERKRLEAILHPRIRELWRAQVELWRSQGRLLAVVAIPLLFETQAEAELDEVLCIACSKESQLERLRGRGWSGEQIAQRMQAQFPIEEKIAKSNYVIWSESSLEIHAAQLDRILARL
jgi:dephospho-CoA kinase